MMSAAFDLVVSYDGEKTVRASYRVSADGILRDVPLGDDLAEALRLIASGIDAIAASKAELSILDGGLA